jgi:hypothetical protein
VIAAHRRRHRRAFVALALLLPLLLWLALRARPDLPVNPGLPPEAAARPADDAEGVR